MVHQGYFTHAELTQSDVGKSDLKEVKNLTPFKAEYLALRHMMSRPGLKPKEARYLCSWSLGSLVQVQLTLNMLYCHYKSICSFIFISLEMGFDISFTLSSYETTRPNTTIDALSPYTTFSMKCQKSMKINKCHL